MLAPQPMPDEKRRQRLPPPITLHPLSFALLLWLWAPQVALALCTLPPLSRAAVLGCATASERATLVEHYIVSAAGRFDPSLLLTELRAAGDYSAARDVAIACCAHGCMPHAPVCDALSAALRKDGRLEEAVEVIDALHAAGGRSNPSQSAALMAALARAGRSESAMRLLDRMGDKADHQTHAMLLSGLLAAGDEKTGAALCKRLRAMGRTPDLPLFNVMLQTLLRAGHAVEASALMDELRAARLKPNERTLNVLLTSFTSAGQLPAAIEMFNSFLDSGGRPTSHAYNVLIDAFARCGELVNAEILAQQMRGGGIPPDTYTLNALLRACATAREPRRGIAHYLLARRRGVRPDSASFSLLVWALKPVGQGLRAAKLAKEWVMEMESQQATLSAQGLPLLDAVACAELLRCCCQKQTLSHRTEAGELAAWLWEQLLATGVEPTDMSRADAIRALGMAGKMEAAFGLFEAAQAPRAQIVWQAMLSSCGSDVEMGNRVLATLGRTATASKGTALANKVSQDGTPSSYDDDRESNGPRHQPAANRRTAGDASLAEDSGDRSSS